VGNPGGVSDLILGTAHALAGPLVELTKLRHLSLLEEYERLAVDD